MHGGPEEGRSVEVAKLMKRIDNPFKHSQLEIVNDKLLTYNTNRELIPNPKRTGR